MRPTPVEYTILSRGIPLPSARIIASGRAGCRVGLSWWRGCRFRNGEGILFPASGSLGSHRMRTATASLRVRLSPLVSLVVALSLAELASTASAQDATKAEAAAPTATQSDAT